MAVTITSDSIVRRGGTNNFGITCPVVLDSSYPTGGYSINADAFGLSQIDSVLAVTSAGYTVKCVKDSDSQGFALKLFDTASGTTGATSGGTPAGTNTASTALDLATPVFSGTGQSSAGQVITTTDNQTMTLDQCKGMWFVSATHGPYLIESNTAVTGAQAVLTIYGTAPTTDAGTYRIYKNAAQTFAGSALSTHTHTTSAAAETEVANATDVSSVTVLLSIEGK